MTSNTSLSRAEPARTSISPVGNTAVTSTGKIVDLSTRSATKLVLTVLGLATRGLEASASIVQLVESLIWPFVARRSLRTTWFTDEELGKFAKSMRKTAVTLSSLESADNREQTFIKFWVDTALCQVVGDHQRPVKDDWITNPLFSGWCRRNVLRAIARRDVSFIYSLQKGAKQAWPALGEVKKEMALEKHKVRLSTFHGLCPGDLLTSIQDTCQEVNRGIWSEKQTKFLPTGSACLQASVKKGGALGLFEHYQMPFTATSMSPECKTLGRLPVLNASLNAWRTKTYAQCFEQAKERLRYVPGDLEVPGNIPALRVKIEAIPEPGKYRIITKGDGYLYSALQPMQGALLNKWKRHEASTMLLQDLSTKVTQMDQAVELPLWCSVDYEAATDLLKKDASLQCFCALKGMPGWDLAISSLGRGRAEYPDGSVIDFDEAQLMGHPLSFASLCVINLAVYRCALLRWQNAAPGSKERRKLVALMWRNVLVNGDDMLFKCNMSFFSVFAETAADAGFKFSQGKNYISPDCALINSQMFQRRGGVMRRMGYLNQRFLSGSSIKTGESMATPTGMGKEINEMVKNCPWANCIVPKIFSRWKQDYFGPIYRPGWYMPVHLGGFGLDPSHGPSDWSPNRAQRLMAARFVSDPRMALYRRQGGSGSIPLAKLQGALANWKMVVGDYVPNKYEVSDADPWLERLAYAARAAFGSEPGKADDAAMIARFFRPEYRLKPMSLERIELYRYARLVAVSTPVCPPIGLIKVKTVPLDSHMLLGLFEREARDPWHLMLV